MPRKSLGFVEEVFRTFAFLDVDEDEEVDREDNDISKAKTDGGIKLTDSGSVSRAVELAKVLMHGAKGIMTRAARSQKDEKVRFLDFFPLKSCSPCTARVVYKFGGFPKDPVRDSSTSRYEARNTSQYILPTVCPLSRLLYFINRPYKILTCISKFVVALVKKHPDRIEAEPDYETYLQTLYDAVTGLGTDKPRSSTR